jgi:hypothetical protein
MSSRLGFECYAYRNTGSWASPTWNLLDGVRDATLNLKKDTADASSRRSKWKLIRSAMRDGSIEIEMLWDRADPDFAALLTAWLNDTQVDCVFLDDPVATTGAQGPRAWYEVVDLTRSEPLNDTVKAKITLHTAYPQNDVTQVPQWWTT